MRKKVLVKGPVLSQSGYGEQSRFALRALRSREDLFEIYIINIPWGKTGQIIHTSEERTWLDNRLLKTQEYVGQGGAFDVSLQVTIPIEWEKIAPLNVGYTAGIETSKVVPEWLVKGNEMVDKIITISEHSRKSYAETTYEARNEETGEVIQSYGLQKPIDVVNYPVKNITPDPIDLNLETNKNFLVVSQWGPRKNLENTIRWFIEEFHDDDDVGLVLKTNMAKDCLYDREITSNNLRGLLAAFPDRKCKVYLIHGTLTEAQLHSLYVEETMKAIISLTHGEGFGLPLFEAAYSGLPIITVPWSGQLDYISKPNKKGKRVNYIIPVKYDLKQVQKHVVWKGVVQEDSMWAYARQNSYKQALRESLTKEKHYKMRAKTLQKHIQQEFSEEKIYKEFVTAFAGEVKDAAAEEIEFINEIKQLVEDKDLKYIIKNKFMNYPADYSTRTQMIKNLYEDKECYVLTCGPSLTNYTPDELREKLQDKIVIAVKQAYEYVPDIVDIHVYNCNNYQSYDYGDSPPLVVGCSSLPEDVTTANIWAGTSPDLFYRIHGHDYTQAICNSLAFDAHTLDQTLDRPWGPGIMTEVVFYLTEHLGFKSVRTVGWDLETPGTTESRHFYEPRELINPADDMVKDEIAKNIAMTKHLHAWLEIPRHRFCNC